MQRLRDDLARLGYLLVGPYVREELDPDSLPGVLTVREFANTSPDEFAWVVALAIDAQDNPDARGELEARAEERKKR